VKPTATGPRYKPPLAAIRIGAADRVDIETRYGTMLTWYMRALSLLWMVQGLLDWSTILTAGEAGPDLFETMSFLAGTAVMFFCVLDLIAAVGLWLAAAWGGVVWLVAVAAQWLAVLTLPGLFPFGVLIAIADVALVAGYFYLTYRAARESESYM
jgi:hypothetical protein